MKKLLICYFVILAPLFVLKYYNSNRFIKGRWFVIRLMIYAFIYRNITDYFRLHNNEVIGKMNSGRYWYPEAGSVILLNFILSDTAV